MPEQRSTTTSAGDLSPNAALEKFASILRGRLFLRHATLATAAGLFLIGILVLGARAIASWPIPTLSFFAWLLIPCLVWAWRRAERETPRRQTLLALLDRANGGGGLVMADGETPLGEWRARVGDLRIPEVTWNGNRALGIWVTALAFAVACVVVPFPTQTRAETHALNVERETAKLSAQIETLKQETVIDPAKAETLKEKLDAVSNEAKGEDPVKTWEALDHLDDSLKQTASKAAEKDVQSTESIRRSQELAEALDQGALEADEQRLSEALSELEKQMESLAGGNDPASKELSKALSDKLKEALKNGTLDAKQLKELAEALSKAKQGTLQRLQNLKNADLIDLKTLQACEKAGQCDSAGLAEFLEKNKKSGSVAELTDQYGRGGVTRGRADAPMSWTEGTSEKGAKFKEQTLQGSISDLQNSQLVGLTTGAPTVETNANSRPGALAGSTTGGGSANTQTVLPRHRKSVKRYFERP